MIVMNQPTYFGNVLVVDGQGTVKLKRQMPFSLYVDAKVNHWAVDRNPGCSIIANSRTPEIIINFLIVRKLTFYNKNADFVWAKMLDRCQYPCAPQYETTFRTDKDALCLFDSQIIWNDKENNIAFVCKKRKQFETIITSYWIKMCAIFFTYEAMINFAPLSKHHYVIAQLLLNAKLLPFCIYLPRLK